MPVTSTTTDRYDRFSQALHGVTAIAVVVGFTLGPEHFGRLMRDGLDPATRPDIVWHESLGVLVLLLTLVRIGWVALRPAPPRLAMPVWMHRASRLVQAALWLLLLALPATALLALGSEGHPLTLLGGLRIDRMPLIAGSAIAPLADWGDVHGFLGDAMIALAGVHAAAGLVHHLVLRDGVLASMWPGLRRR